jgi:hypothetical protein
LFMLMMLICWLEAYTKTKNTEGLLVASKQIGLEVNNETKAYWHVSRPACRKKHSIKISKNYNLQNCNFASSFAWVRDLVFHIQGGI